MKLETYRISIERTDLPKRQAFAWTVEWLCNTTWKVKANGFARSFEKAERTARRKAQLIDYYIRRSEHYEITYMIESEERQPEPEPDPIVVARWGARRDRHP